MEFVAARDFRIRPGQVWKRLRKSGNLLITSNGKPIAMLRDIKGHDIEEELRIQARAKGLSAVSRIRAHALRKGLNTLSGGEIDKEIALARKCR
jgi:hypothetical protein